MPFSHSFLPLLAVGTATLLASTSAQAAVLLTQNFDTFEGSAATLPTGFTVSGTPSNYVGIFTSGTSTYSTANGIYAGTQSSNLSDRSFAARVPAGSNLLLTFSVTNNTGSTVPGLSLTFDQEQYQTSTATPNFINVLSNNGSGTTFDQVNLSGNISNQELNAAGGDTVFATPLTASRSVSYNAAVPAGGSVSFQFSFVPGGSGNRPIHGIDNVVVSTIPEPGTIGLLALTTAGMMTLRRRRK